MYTVIPGFLYAGATPEGISASITGTTLHSLFDMGINTLLSLREPNPEISNPVNLESIVFQEFGDTISIKRYPVPDFGVPSKEKMRVILDAIHDSVAAGNCTYVFCTYGIGRTGTAIACWLREHYQIDGKQALLMLAGLRQHSGAWGKMASPETEAQRRFVQEWEF
jgi:protein-tyrosine phosphatase